jgi:hypothetical protein
MFKNDFAQALFKAYSYRINTNSMQEQDKKAIEKYMHNNFYLIVDKKKTTNYTIDKIKFDETSVYLSFKIKTHRSFKSLTIHNSLLTELFRDQKNLVIIKLNDFEKGITFTAGKTEIKV